MLVKSVLIGVVALLVGPLVTTPDPAQPPVGPISSDLIPFSPASCTPVETIYRFGTDTLRFTVDVAGASGCTFYMPRVWHTRRYATGAGVVP